MPGLSEAGYRHPSDSDKAVSRPLNSTTESHVKQANESDDSYYLSKTGSARSGSWTWSLPTLLSRSTSSEPSTIYDNDYKKIKYNELEDLAQGIPQLGGILNKDYGLIRVFLPEAHQLLVRRNTRINKMVKELRENDAKAVARDKNRLSTFEIESESDRVRAESLDKLEEEIFELYDKVITVVKIKALAKPSERSHRYFQHWMVDHRPLREDEADFVNHFDDMVHLRKETKCNNQHGDQLDIFIKGCLSRKPGSFLDRFIAEESTMPGHSYYDRDYFAKTRVVFSVAITVSILLAPICLWFLLQLSQAAMVTTVIFFMLLSAVIVALLTNGRLQDVLVGTAAYGAILAFLGNLIDMNQYPASAP